MDQNKLAPALSPAIKKRSSKSETTLAKEELLKYENILHELKTEFEMKWNNQDATKTIVSISDFEKYRTLGTGAFGRVILAKEKSSHKYYAIKILKKTKIVRLKQVQHTVYEKKVLTSINFPFAIIMEYVFKDNSYIYFVLPFITGGEMYTHLRRKRKFDENLSKFYAAQVVLTLEYLHHLDLLYRDLKPENILIDCEGYIKITDFGFCKLVKGRTWTLCGTPEYLAPEIILSKGYGSSADWWSCGVLIYEMVAGYSPFYASDSMMIYEKIVSGKYKFAQHFSSELRDLLHNILQLDLTRRYGNLKNGTVDIKTHMWFKDINWLHIYYRKVEPPYIPSCKSLGDTSNFDTFEEEPLNVLSVDEYKKEFEEI